MTEKGKGSQPKSNHCSPPTTQRAWGNCPSGTGCSTDAQSWAALVLVTGTVQTLLIQEKKILNTLHTHLAISH